MKTLAKTIFLITLVIYFTGCASEDSSGSIDLPNPAPEYLGIDLDESICKPVYAPLNMYAYYDTTTPAGVAVFTSLADCQNRAATWYDMGHVTYTDPDFDFYGYPDLTFQLTVVGNIRYLLIWE